MSARFKFVQNAACEYFPCHKGADPATFNCLFCYCPLYFLRDCGGNPSWIGPVKDCTNCLAPHSPGGWEAVQKRLKAAYADLRAGRPLHTIGGPSGEGPSGEGPSGERPASE